MEVTVDLRSQRIRADGFETAFAIDPFYRECLLNGWDEVALTLRQEGEITRYESTRAAWLPISR